LLLNGHRIEVIATQLAGRVLHDHATTPYMSSSYAGNAEALHTLP